MNEGATQMTEQNPEKQPSRQRFSRRWLLAGLGATALVTAGTALAQEGTPTPSQLPSRLESLIDSVAQKLGVESDDLRQAVVEALQESGYDTSKGFGRHRGYKRWGRRGKWGGWVLLDTAANYVGLDKEAFIERLRNGESAAQIAEAEGKTRDGLITALTDAMSAQLDQFVQDGKLTQEQADAKRSYFEENIPAWVDTSKSSAGGRHKWKWHRPDQDSTPEPADPNTSV